jgi:hypothetical protein
LTFVLACCVAIVVVAAWPWPKKNCTPDGST